MPVLVINSNVPSDRVEQSDLLQALSKAISQYVLVTLNLGVPLSFGGTEEPAAYGTLLSIGAISPSQNKNTSKLVSDILQAKLSVPPKRFYLSVRWLCLLV
ncbi:hypothetical protein WJX81_000886 [Elliptochloris bilobata]|uniref:L-dopachrome isomerase n=1 Tax=Elliptochloris bilobata TaxID=381761 RepID=A0AAW1SEW6_9CHLO